MFGVWTKRNGDPSVLPMLFRRKLKMTNEELISTLRTASESVKDNIALSMLLIMAAERIEDLNNA